MITIKLQKQHRLLSIVVFWMSSLFSAILLLIVLEVLLGFFWPQTSRTIFKEQKSLGLEDPFLFHVLRPYSRTTVHHPEFTATYEINQNGLRDNSEHLNPKPQGLTRILILGGSFTFGEGNDYNAIWPVIFESTLLERGYHVDVIKVGIPAYDTRTEVLLLERLFPQYNPNVIIITFLTNDLFTNTFIEVDRSDSNWQDTAREVTQWRKQKKLNLHSVILTIRILFSNDYLFTKIYLATARSEYFKVPISTKVQRQIDITKTLFLKAKEYLLEKECMFVLLSIPQQFQVIVEANNYKPNEINVRFIDEVFSEFGEQQGIPWIPTLTVLAEQYRRDKSDLYFRFDGHLNNQGNAVIGKYISEKFIDIFRTR